MADITIYTRPMCGFCVRAVALLKKKGVKFTEIDAGWDAAKKKEMVQRSGGASTYPQIFVGDVHIGGCDDLLQLEQASKLDAMLAME
jgi:glutaredoxin 3